MGVPFLKGVTMPNFSRCFLRPLRLLRGGELLRIFRGASSPRASSPQAEGLTREPEGSGTEVRRRLPEGSTDRSTKGGRRRTDGGGHNMRRVVRRYGRSHRLLCKARTSGPWVWRWCGAGCAYGAWFIVVIRDISEVHFGLWESEKTPAALPQRLCDVFCIKEDFCKKIMMRCGNVEMWRRQRS